MTTDRESPFSKPHPSNVRPAHSLAVHVESMMTVVILFVLISCVSCASVDVWHFIRAFHFILNGIAIRFLKKFGVLGRKYSLKDVLSPVVFHGIVLPSDIDHHMHMNNSKYLRKMDFGRLKTYFECGLFEANYDKA